MRRAESADPPFGLLLPNTCPPVQGVQFRDLWGWNPRAAMGGGGGQGTGGAVPGGGGGRRGGRGGAGPPPPQGTCGAVPGD